MIPGPEVRARRWQLSSRRIFALAVIIAGVFGTYLALSANRPESHRIDAAATPPGGIAVKLNLVRVQDSYSEIVGDLAVQPGSDLVDPATDGLKQDLTVTITSTTTPIKRTWVKGMLPGVFPVPLTLARDVERWPLDTYYTGPITVELFKGSSPVPERATVEFDNRLTGWSTSVRRTTDTNAAAPYEIDLRRSGSTMLFSVVILGIFVAIAALGVFVAIKTFQDPRRFQSPLTTWYAAMLFAVVPLRNALPGSPVFGSWIDLTIVLWVLVALVISMLLYIAAWWRATSQT